MTASESVPEPARRTPPPVPVLPEGQLTFVSSAWWAKMSLLVTETVALPPPDPPAGPGGPLGPAGPGAPAGPAGPAGPGVPFGSSPALKSDSTSVPRATFLAVTAWSLSWIVPTLAGASAFTAATL